MFFKRSWKDLHKRFCEVYEDIAIQSLVKKDDSGPFDFKVVIRAVLREIDPEMTEKESAGFVDSAYLSFKAFDVREEIADACRKENPEMADAALEAVFAEIKQLYLEKMEEHNAFLIFVISRFLDPEIYNIGRGKYFFEIALGRVPMPGVWRTAEMIAKYKQVKEVKERGRGFKNDINLKNADFQKAKSLNMDDVIAAFNCGLRASKNGEADVVIEEINKVVAWLQPYVPAYHAAMGGACEKEGDKEEAYKEFAQASEINPRLAQAHLMRGMAYCEKGEIVKGIADYDASIKIAPSYSAYFNRALAYKKIKNVECALEDFSAAIAQDQSSYLAYAARGKVYAEKEDCVSAICDFTKAISLNPKLPDLYAMRGLFYFHVGDNENAIEDYTCAIRLNPTHAEFFKNRAQVYIKLGKAELARADSEEYKRLLASKG